LPHWDYPYGKNLSSGNNSGSAALLAPEVQLRSGSEKTPATKNIFFFKTFFKAAKNENGKPGRPVFLAEGFSCSKFETISRK